MTHGPAIVALLAIPLVTSWAQALSLLLILASVYAAWRVYRHRRDEPAAGLDSQPLLPGEARWIVGRHGMVLDSCVHESETGIGSGWAVGHAIAEWAAPGTPEAEHYRSAMEDRAPASFEARHTSPAGDERVARVQLQPRSDGTVYCESWDVTAYVRRAEAAEQEAATLREQRDRLMRYSATDADALFAAGLRGAAPAAAPSGAAAPSATTPPSAADATP